MSMLNIGLQRNVKSIYDTNYNKPAEYKMATFHMFILPGTIVL